MISTLILDEVLPNPHEVRETALSFDFGEQTGPDGAVYKHISLEGQPTAAIGERLQPMFPGKVIKWHLTFWRQDWHGESPHSFCHSDRICAEYAALYYAMPPELCSGGTAFWRHIGTGLDHLPTDATLIQAGIQPHFFHPWMTDETKNPDQWGLQGLVAMKTNRLVVYPTKLWHSRMPAEGSGSCQEDGRMVWVGFFNLV